MPSLDQDEIINRKLAIAKLSGKIEKLEISGGIASRYLPISSSELKEVLKYTRIEKYSIKEINEWIHFLSFVPKKEIFFKAGGEFKIHRGLRLGQLEKLKASPGNFWKVVDEGKSLIPNINTDFEANYIDQLAVIKLDVMNIPQTIRGIVCVFDNENTATKLTLEGDRFEPTQVRVFRSKSDLKLLREKFLPDQGEERRVIK